MSGKRDTEQDGDGPTVHTALLPRKERPPSLALPVNENGEPATSAVDDDVDLNTDAHNTEKIVPPKRNVIKEKLLSIHRLYRPMYVFLIYIFFYYFTNITMPILPGIKRRYYGSDQQAAMVQTSMDCAKATIGLFTAAIYGKMLDSFGRRPFLILLAMTKIIQNGLYLIFPDQIFAIMLCVSVMGLIQQSVTYTFVSDRYGPKDRILMFAAVTGISCFGSTFDLLVIALDDFYIFLIAAIGGLIAVILAVFCLDETLDPKLRVPLSLKSLENPFKSMVPLLRSKASMTVVAVLSFFIIAQCGTSEVYVYYLHSRVGFNSNDNAIFMTEDSVMKPIMFMIVLPLLARYLSRVLLLMTTIVALFLELILCITIWAKWPVYAFATPIVAYSNIIVPLALSILSSQGDESDQGRRLSGIAAVMDLCLALGPLFFGQIYGHAHGGWVILPFVISGVIAIPAAVLSLFVEKFIKKEEEEKKMKEEQLAAAAKGATSEGTSITATGMEGDEEEEEEEKEKETTAEESPNSMKGNREGGEK